MAKLIIKLMNAVADTVNRVLPWRVVSRSSSSLIFSVKRAQSSGDLSAQISVAGNEASGTGNMKFALNDALTIGTLDGANVEIREEVGAENFSLFGLTVEQVRDLKRRGYRPRDFTENNASLREVLDIIGSGALTGGDSSVFRPLLDHFPLPLTDLVSLAARLHWGRR